MKGGCSQGAELLWDRVGKGETGQVGLGMGGMVRLVVK